MRSQKSIYSLNFVVKCWVDMTGGSSWFMGLCWAQEALCYLTGLSSPQDYQLAHYRCAVCSGRRYCLSHLAIQLFIASKVISYDLKVSDNISSSPKWRSWGSLVSNKKSSKLNGVEQLLLSICWSVLLNQFPTSMCDNIDNREQYSIEFLILEQIFV